MGQREHNDIVEELRPADAWLDTEETQYWIDAGKLRWRQASAMRGVDRDSFVFFRSGFARDLTQAYCVGRRLAGSDGSAFRPLNFCYHTDGTNVWTLGGTVSGAHVATFGVCDQGFRRLFSGDRVPSGYARDREQVYYYGFEGRASPIRSADPESFESVGDSVFGRDAKRVFCRKKILRKADPTSWRQLLGGYSRDGRRAFYDDREMPGVDPDRLSIHPLSSGIAQLAEAGGIYFRNDTVITEETYLETIRKYGDSTPVKK